MLDLSSVQILSSNPVYRVSDVILQRGIRWQKDRDTILSLDKYEDTILRKYLERKSSENDYDELAKVIEEHGKERGYRRPSGDELVMHVRTGDIFSDSVKEAGRRTDLNIYDAFIRQLDIREMNISRIVVVTAMHFGANDLNGNFFLEQKAVDRSYELLKNIDLACDRLGVDTQLYSNRDTDMDLYFMVSSQHFVKGNSNIGDIVAKCLPRYATISEAFLPKKQVVRGRRIIDSLETDSSRN